MMNNQISHKDFPTIINEEINYRELKESTGMMKGQENKKKKQILIKSSNIKQCYLIVLLSKVQKKKKHKK